DFLNKLYQISQSNSSFLLNGVLNFELILTEKVSGKGKRKNAAPISVEEYRKKKKCIIKIQNDDNSCGYRAITLAKFYHENPNKNLRLQVQRNQRNRLTILAQELCETAGIDINTALSVNDLYKIDDVLKPLYQLIVINGTTMSLDYKGNKAPKQLYIELYNEHYNFINKITAYFECSYFCVKCFKGYSHQENHRCKDGCYLCHHEDKCVGDKIHCDSCNKNFNGQFCFNRHVNLKLCEKLKYCFLCYSNYREKIHKCDTFHCFKCARDYKVTPHFCCIEPKNIEKLMEEDNKNKIIVCFDIESQLINEENITIHSPNLLISLTACEKCFNYDTLTKNSNCDVCGVYKNVFFGDNCVKHFGEYLYNDLAKKAEKEKCQLLVFAHNFKGYDGHFVFRDLFDRDFTTILPIMNGTKLLKIDVGNTRFIDSLSFFQLPLAALPKSFGFSELVKGYFPYKFNTPENIDYIGNIPDKDYFNYERMKEGEKESFNVWYTSFNSSSYNFKEEMIKYCMNDVHILLKSVYMFKKQFKDITEIDPLSRNFTLAAIGLEVFRAKYLKQDSLGINPISYGTKQSKIANSWLDFTQSQYSQIIKREFKIGPYFSDGCIPEEKIVFEFHGCFYHGCPLCNDIFSENQPDEEGWTFKDKYLKTVRRTSNIRSMGYQVIEKWECQFNQDMISNESLKTFIDDRLRYYNKLEIVGEANIRESFFGGRTNNIQFFYETSENEVIEYKDVCSLYPFVLKNKHFPVNHPQIITSNFDYSLDYYFGFIKCKVLPPNNLYLPVLPMRYDHKLKFVLCNKCSELMQQTECHHTDEERSLTNTWTSIELKEALDKGYKVMEIYQVLHYENKDDTLFKEYINTWLKVKQEASGWPSWVQTEVEKHQYIQNFETREGIQLDFNNIQKNPGRRFIAKLMLNSFWGKLAQRPNHVKSVVCHHYAEYWNVINDDKYKVEGEYMPNDSTIILSYKFKDDNDADLGNTSIAISSFVTAYARLELYKIMEKINNIGEDRLLYFDTDSVIFVKKHGDQVIETGDYLGDLTDEIKDNYGPTAFCRKFVSCGPKNYGLEIQKNENESHSTLKVKGIRLDGKSLEILNLDLMKNLAEKYIEGHNEQISIEQFKISCDKYNHFVTSKYFDKVYRVVSEKRKIVSYKTFPFGYK
ncbi:MAG: DNA polymerase, partial [Limnohabitans sp.]|nr:DNA polymerase [Limnohabitans sp.]